MIIIIAICNNLRDNAPGLPWKCQPVIQSKKKIFTIQSKTKKPTQVYFSVQKKLRAIEWCIVLLYQKKMYFMAQRMNDEGMPPSISELTTTTVPLRYNVQQSSKRTEEENVVPLAVIHIIEHSIILIYA